MNRKIYLIFMAAVLVLFFSGIGQSEPLSPQLCKQKVEAAAKLLQQEGNACFAKLKDPNGEFRFAGGKGYVWVHDLNGVMLMHPIKPSLDGKGILDIADANGSYLFVNMNDVVEAHGAGWVPYLWPKPGEKKGSPKISYVKLVKHGGKSYVVGSGMYDVTANDIKKLFPKDSIYNPDE